MLENWDEFITILNININKDNEQEIKIKSDFFKLSINNYISNTKFNIKNIISNSNS